MLYQPSFPSPYLSTIDANEKNTFRFKVNGDCVVAYQILIYNASTNELVYEGNKEDCCVYGNDGDDSFIEVIIPAYKTDENGDYITDENGNKITILTNGLDYVWKAKLWQKTHDIEVVRGRVYEEVTSGSAIKIRPHIEDSVREGMILRIGAQDYIIKSCVLQHPKIYSNKSSNEAGYIYVDPNSEGYDQITDGDYITIGGLGNSYNKNTKIYQVSYHNTETVVVRVRDTSFSNTIAGVTYIQNTTPSLYSTAKIDGDISNTITAGTEYVVLSDYVECDVGFFFKARTTPELIISNNGKDIENNTISNTHSSINIRASYLQEQGSNIKYWNITLKSGGRTVHTTGNVYNNKIEYYYDSLLPQEYILDIIVENNDGTILEQNINIDVNYNDANALLTPKTKLEYDSAVKIDWGDSYSIVGSSTFDANDDSYDSEQQCIILKDEQSVLWDNIDTTNPLNLTDPTVVSTLVTNLNSYDGVLVEIFDSNGTDKIEVGYNSKEFWWTINGDRYYYNPYTDGVIEQVGVDKDHTNSSDILYLWDDGNNKWNSSDDYIWHYNDIGSMYWWLIKVNLYEEDHSKMVTFTKYNKE